jgi:hypothetical protein
MDAAADKRGNNIISLLRFQYCCAAYCDCFILAGLPIYYQPDHATAFIAAVG